MRRLPGRELALYIGCLNLHERLTGKGLPVCCPVPVGMEDGSVFSFSARGLYEISLALTTPGPVAGNDLDADGKPLVMISGADQGGRSTFLRSAGIAQLMLDAGCSWRRWRSRAAGCTWRPD